MLTTKNILSITLSLLAICLVISTTEACTCLPTHPQEQYCNADYGKFCFYFISLLCIIIIQLTNNNLLHIFVMVASRYFDI